MREKYPWFCRETNLVERGLDVSTSWKKGDSAHAQLENVSKQIAILVRKKERELVSFEDIA